MSHALRPRRRHHSRTAVAALLALVAGLAAMLVPAGPVAATSPVPPHVDTISSNHGPAAGGNEIMVTGYRLDDGLGIYFGSNRGQIVSKGSGTVTVKVPPGLSGTTVLVYLSTSVDNDYEGPTVPSPLAYTYDGKTRRALKPSPDHGSPLGGTTVTLTGPGIDFRDPQSVTFDGTPAEVLSSTATSVTVKTPARSTTSG